MSASASSASEGPTVSGTSLGPDLCPAVDPSTRWSGLRPMTPDGLPVIGEVGMVGDTPVFINAGHGALGWTLSAGSGIVLAEGVASAFASVQHRKPPIATSGAASRQTLADLASRMMPARFRWPDVLRRA